MVLVQACPEYKKNIKKFSLQMSHTSRWNRPYLGIEIPDSVAMTIRLPADKLQQSKAIIKQWFRCRKCTKRELLSLIGLLAFASKVVKPGRMFLRRLIDLSTTVDSLNHYIYLNLEVGSTW